jgi:exosortase H (IPTLxxWG-CTERM-specific)
MICGSIRRHSPVPLGLEIGRCVLRRFVLLFALFAGVGFGLVLAPPLEPVVGYLTRLIATASAVIIHIGGGHVRVAAYTLVAPDGFAIVVANGCNGINVVVMLWSALLAWPAGRWSEKVKGMGLGMLAIQAANTLRIITLFYLGQWNQQWFEVMHLYVWEILIMVLGLALFAMWVRRTPATAIPDGAK